MMSAWVKVLLRGNFLVCEWMDLRTDRVKLMSADVWDLDELPRRFLAEAPTDLSRGRVDTTRLAHCARRQARAQLT